MPSFPLFQTDFRGGLSADQSAELADRVAGLARAGLPLDGGLRALADELPTGRLARVLRRLAGQLSAGMSLEAALQAPGCRLPAHVRGLIAAGVRSGRLAGVLEGLAEVTRRRQQLRRRAAVSLAYPALLLAIMAFIAVLFDTVIMPGFRAMFREFGMNLPKLTTALLAAAGPIAWTLAIGTLVLLVLPVVSCLLPLGRVLSAVVDRVPLLGPIRCYGRLAELSGLMALLVEQEVPLPEALRLAAGAVRAPGLAAECRRAAAAVESGLPLATVFDASCCVPPTMAMLVAWGQQTGSLPQAFHTSATMFQARAERQGLFLETIMLPITFLAVIFFTGVAILALLLPLVSLIQNLSGGGF